MTDHLAGYTRLTPLGEKALKVVTRLAKDIAAAWETLKRNVAGGMSFAAALVLFLQTIRDLLRDAYAEVWIIGRGDDFGGETELTNVEEAIAQDVTEMSDYLGKVDEELETIAEDDDPISLLARRLSRVTYYAGLAWALFNVAKTYGAAATEPWRWVGPVDENTCDVCREEMGLGPRPLGEIRRYPGRDSICGANCRHELVRAN